MVFIPMHITIKSHPKNLIDIRHLLADAIAETELTKDDSSSMILAVDEACSNIIRHCYQGDVTKNIDVTINLTDTEMVIAIRDSGPEFDIDSVEKRDVYEVKPGGLGIYIIHHVMDKVEYIRTSDGFNELRLTKNLPE